MKRVALVMVMVILLSITMSGCGLFDSNTPSEIDPDFSKWDETDMQAYLQQEGLFSNEKYIYVQKGADELPVGIDCCLSYMEEPTFDAYVIIFYFDPNSTLPQNAAFLEELRANHTIELDGVPQPFNALVGNFAILWTFSMDDDYIAKFQAGFEKMIKDYKVTPDFTEFDVEMPEM